MNTRILIDLLADSAPREKHPTKRQLVQRKHDVAWLETGKTGDELTEYQRELKRQFYERRGQ